MKKYLCLSALSFAISICLGCQKEMTLLASDTLVFDRPVAKPIVPIVSETSGIADSKANHGFLWAQEDSGNPPNLILLNHDGQVKKSVHLKNAANRDWEDMVLAADQVYIADIGDNNQVFPNYTIYQFTEPASSVDTISEYKTIRFQYPDGSHDAEAFMVDPSTKDIYIITKRDNPSKVFKLAYPYSYSALNMATYAVSLNYSGVVSAALSPDGRNIIVKTYFGLRLYQREQNELISTALQGAFAELPYHLEPQGEAITFAADNSGFYTLSEKGLSNAVNLYFYRKK